MVLSGPFFEYLRETQYKHALEHLEAARSETIWGKHVLLLRKSLTNFDLFEGQ